MDIAGTVRPVREVWQGKPTLEGAGVRLKRAFGFAEVPRLDPFLLLDAFHSENPEDYRAGFPWHPHRGMETITYVLDGEVEHGDSMGNRGLISAGDVQWMTAGSGIIHQEMPRGNRRGEMWGFQLWSNLPAARKMMDPRYQEIRRGEVPEVKTPGGASVRVIAGTLGGVEGPVRDIVTDPEFLDVSLPAGAAWSHPVKRGHTVFAYVVDGAGHFEGGPEAAGHRGAPSGEGTLVLYGPGDNVTVAADRRPVRFLLLAGQPLNEPVAWHGPIVMNTREELQMAFREFEAGTFVKRDRSRPG